MEATFLPAADYGCIEYMHALSSILRSLDFVYHAFTVLVLAVTNYVLLSD